MPESDAENRGVDKGDRLTGKGLFCVIVVGLVMAIGGAGLLLSHYKAGAIYRIEFDQLSGTSVPGTGRVIELSRLLLAAILASVVLLMGFKSEIVLMLRFDSPTKRPRQRMLSRCLFLLIATCLLFPEARRAFGAHTGSYSTKIIEESWKGGLIDEASLDAEFSKTNRAYIWYMLYSAMFYGLIVPMVVSVPLASAMFEVRTLWSQANRLREPDQVIQPWHESAEFVNPLSVSSISTEERLTQRIRTVETFSTLLRKKVQRYMDLIGAVAVFELYEMFFGQVTLSTGAQSFSRFATILCSLSAICLGATWLLYFRVWEHVTSVDGREDEIEEQLTSPYDFLRSLLRRRLSGYAIMILIALSVPLGNFAKLVFVSLKP